MNPFAQATLALLDRPASGIFRGRADECFWGEVLAQVDPPLWPRLFKWRNEGNGDFYICPPSTWLYFRDFSKIEDEVWQNLRLWTKLTRDGRIARCHLYKHATAVASFLTADEEQRGPAWFMSPRRAQISEQNNELMYGPVYLLSRDQLSMLRSGDFLVWPASHPSAWIGIGDGQQSRNRDGRIAPILTVDVQRACVEIAEETVRGRWKRMLDADEIFTGRPLAVRRWRQGNDAIQ